MPRDNRLETRLDEMFRYKRGLSFSDILDVFMYVPKGRYFHTVDGRFARIWKISTLAADVLTQQERLGAASWLAMILNEFPEGGSGQLLRFTHRDVSFVVSEYLANSEAKGFGKELIDAFAMRQLDGAQKGFFAEINEDQISAAKQDIARDGGLDGEGTELMFHNIERSMTTGRFALVTDLYLTFMYTPSWMKTGSMAVSTTKKLLGEIGMLDVKAEYRRVFEKERDVFLGHCKRIESRAANAGYAPAAMNGQALLNILYRELNPIRSLSVPPPEYISGYILRDQLDIEREAKVPDIAKQSTYSVLTTSNEGWKIEGVHYKAVSAKVLPKAITPGKLSDALAYVDGEHWCAINFNVPRQSGIRNALRIRRAAADQTNSAEWMNHPIFRGDSRLTQEKQEDIEAVVYATNVENLDREKVLDISVHVVLKGQDEHEVSESASKMTDLMWNSGFFEVNRGDAMIHQCLPFNYRPAADNLVSRSLRCLATNVGDLAPVFTSYNGVASPGMIVNNEHGAPVFIDIFATRAGHFLIQGTTGSGKSYLANNLLMQLQKFNTKTIVVDKGGSYKSQCQSRGGAYIELVMDATDDARPVCINPFYTRPGVKLSMEDLEFMREIVVAMIECGSHAQEIVKKEHRTYIMDAIKMVFEERNRLAPNEEVVLTDIYDSLMSGFGEEGKAVAQRFKEFTAGYPYGAIFDGPLGISWDNDFIVLETQRMASSPAMSVVMLALFQQVNIQFKHFLPLSRRKLFLVDEAWAVLANPTAATALSGFVREYRKYRAIVGLISQSVKDWSSIVSQDSSAGDGLLVNMRHYFFMPSSTLDYAAGKELLSLSDAQVQTWRSIASLPPFFTECFYHMIDDTERPVDGKFRLYSNSLALWTATTDPTDRSMRDDLFKEHARHMSEPEARARALHELSEKYPFGYRYQQSKSRAA